MHNQTSTGADSALKHTTIRETLAAAGFNVSYVPLKGKGDTGLGREIRADRAAEKAILPSSHPKAIYRNATPEEAKRGVAYVRNSDGAEFDRKMNPIVPPVQHPNTSPEAIPEVQPVQTFWALKESDCVAQLAYDEAKQELAVAYRHSDSVLYIYAAVTASEFIALTQAESIGVHVNKQIKPNHAFRKIVRGDDPDPKTPAAGKIPAKTIPDTDQAPLNPNTSTPQHPNTSPEAAPLALNQTVRDQRDSTKVAAGLALRLQGVRDENSTSGKAPAGPWVYSVLQTYAVRVRTHDLESFRRAYGFHASDDETLDFFLSSAEALWNSDWIPFAEALRLDDEASQYQPVAAGLALRSNIEAAA